MYSFLDEMETSRSMIEEFKGYNHNIRISEGEFYNQTNMTSDNYPVLSPRPKKGYVSPFIVSPNAILGKNQIAYVDGDSFYYGGEQKIPSLSSVRIGGDEISVNTERQLISMGAFILIFPDNCYYNTLTGESGSLGNKREYTASEDNNITYELCKEDGTVLESSDEKGAKGLHKGSTAPEDVSRFPYWLDMSTDPYVLKQWSSYQSQWVGVATCFIKISAPNIGLGFKQYDGVTISGAYPNDDTTIMDFNNTMTIWSVADDWFVVIGFPKSTLPQTTGTIKVERKIPKMDYVCECNNRLWGCYYGLNEERTGTLNEIYCCKAADPFNWQSSMGISTDSWVASVGSDGEWTGCISHGTNIYFFKENCIHIAYGTYTSNFGLKELRVRGVQKGSHKSLCMVNETLYYKSVTDVCAFDGSTPYSVSGALGSVRYGSAVGGGLGNKYYISMQDTDNKWHLFVYDTLSGIWNRFDETKVKCFTTLDSDLYFVTDNNLYIMNGEKSTVPVSLEDDVEWSCETGELGLSNPDNKYVSRLQIRAEIGTGSQVFIEMQYNSDGKWINTAALPPHENISTVVIPILIPRCDHYKMRIYGKGNCKIYSITRVTERGSEVEV